MMFRALGSNKTRGAKFWLKVMNELRNREVEDILIAVVGGLKGSGGHQHGFPLASVQTCIVHFGRYCLSFCGWRERQAVARELMAIYRAETAEVAAKRLEEFDAGPWGKKYPMIAVLCSALNALAAESISKAPDRGASKPAGKGHLIRPPPQFGFARIAEDGKFLHGNGAPSA